MNSATNVTSFPEMMAPVGFVARPDGIYQQIAAKNDDDDMSELHVCGPIQVTSFARNTGGSGWSKVVVFSDPDGRAQQVLLPEDMTTAAKMKVLKGQGLWIGVGPARKAFELLLSSWNPNNRLTLVDRFGWSDEAHGTFMLTPEIALGDTKVIFHNDTISATDARNTRLGTAIEWREHVSALCIGNPLMITAVSLAFAGPLLGPLNMEGGGLHLRGESSSGKTTLLRLALSVWDKPKESLWLSTVNALEPTLSRKNSTILAIDELGLATTKEVGNAVYMFGNGQGKARLRSSGQAANSARWLTSVLSSGEVSLAAHMAKGGNIKMAGQEVRLLDISADTRPHAAFDNLHGFADVKAFAAHLNHLLPRYFGTAGEAFVCRLLERDSSFEKARNYFDLALRFMLADLSVCGSLESRAAKRFAVIAAAGELATFFGITGWPKGLAFSAAKEIFLDWLERREDIVQAKFTKEELRVSVRQIMGFEETMASQIQISGGPAVATPVAFRNDDLLYLPATTWEGLRNGSDVQDLAKALKREGVLKAGDGKNLQCKFPKAFGMGETRAYAIKLNALHRWPERSERSAPPETVTTYSDHSDGKVANSEPCAPAKPAPLLRLVQNTDPTIPTIPK